MTVTLTPHLNTRGRTREVLEFYRSVFGGRIVLATYADIHAAESPEQGGDIAYGQLESPNGFRVAAYDVQPSKEYDAGVNPFYLVLRGDDADEIQRQWDALAEGGTVLVPKGSAPFAPDYGMLTDRFGTTWIIDVTAPSGD